MQASSGLLCWLKVLLCPTTAHTALARKRAHMHLLLHTAALQMPFKSLGGMSVQTWSGFLWSLEPQNPCPATPHAPGSTVVSWPVWRESTYVAYVGSQGCSSCCCCVRLLCLVHCSGRSSFAACLAPRLCQPVGASAGAVTPVCFYAVPSLRGPAV